MSDMAYIARRPDGVFDEVTIDHGDAQTYVWALARHASGVALEHVPLDWALKNMGTNACWPAATVSSSPAPDVPPPSILDAAIAASSALDPLGSRKPDDHLRVPTWDEREAERKRVAERIASMGRGQ